MLRHLNSPLSYLGTFVALACMGAAHASSQDRPMTPSPQSAPGDVQADQPITLVVSKHEGLVEARVVSAAPCQCAGRFRIETESGTANHTTNSSSFRSSGTAGQVMSNIRFGGSDDWRVRLTVSIDGREDYTVIRSSADGI